MGTEWVRIRERVDAEGELHRGAQFRAMAMASVLLWSMPEIRGVCAG